MAVLSTPVLRAEPPSWSHSGSDRQHHQPVLSELDRNDQVPLARPVDLGDHSVVPGRGHHSSLSPSLRVVFQSSALSVKSSLDKGIANPLFGVWESPCIDIFTARANAKMPVFYKPLNPQIFEVTSFIYPLIVITVLP